MKPRGDSLGSNVATVDMRTLKAVYDVRAVLPKLAKESRRWSARRICPVCMGLKSQTSKRCQKCFERERNYVRQGSPQVHTGPVAPTMHGGSAWGASAARRTGHERVQPTRTRMVKQPDGSWAKEPA